MNREYIYFIILIVVSPLFEVFLANLIGYHEPLDLVAEKLGLSEMEEFTGRH